MGRFGLGSVYVRCVLMQTRRVLHCLKTPDLACAKYFKIPTSPRELLTQSRFDLLNLFQSVFRAGATTGGLIFTFFMQRKSKKNMFVPL